jgi:hypothetical protein
MFAAVLGVLLTVGSYDATGRIALEFSHPFHPDKITKIGLELR